MTNVQEKQNSAMPRGILHLTSLWAFHRSPTTFVIALLIVAIVVTLSLIIPQEPNNFPSPGDFVIWYSNLSPSHQQLYQASNIFGLTKIYQNFWLWLPLAWLSLICLIIIGDYAWPTKHRLGKQKKKKLKAWPHPLSYHQKETIRLEAPADSSESVDTDETIVMLERHLLQQGYQIHPSKSPSKILATRFSWRWSGPLLVISGIFLSIVAISIQFIWGQTEEVLIFSQRNTNTTFINQPIRLKTFSPTANNTGNLSGGLIQIDIGNEQNILWQLYRPYRFQDWWIITAKVQPLATVTFRQTQITNNKTDLAFNNATDPVYFVYAPKSLRFELHYLVKQNTPDYRLTLLTPITNTISNTTVIQKDKNFLIPALDLEGEVSIEDRLLLRAYKIPAMFLFVLAGLLFLGGIIQSGQTPPSIIYLSTHSKGRGSHLKIVLETLGPSPLLKETLAQLQLTINDKIA